MDSQHNKIRSVRRSLGRGTERCATISCCRSITFSAARLARLTKNALTNAQITRKMPISVPPCLPQRAAILRERPPLGKKRKSFGIKADGVFGRDRVFTAG